MNRKSTILTNGIKDSLPPKVNLGTASEVNLGTASVDLTSDKSVDIARPRQARLVSVAMGVSWSFFSFLLFHR
jgi:hypothetical protein